MRLLNSAATSQGGVYHGRVLLPPEYPFKPPAFMLLTPSGRFEVSLKCLTSQWHQPFSQSSARCQYTPFPGLHRQT